MTLYTFKARCPHCNHEFTVRIDEEKNKNKKGKLTCPSCKNICQIEGDGTYYLTPAKPTNKKDSLSKPNLKKMRVISMQKDEGIIYELLVLVSILLIGYVAFAALPLFSSDALSLQNLHANLHANFRIPGDSFLELGKAVILSAIAGFVVFLVIFLVFSYITDTEPGRVANILGGLVLCFVIYGEINYEYSDSPNELLQIDQKKAIIQAIKNKENIDCTSVIKNTNELEQLTNKIPSLVYYYRASCLSSRREYALALNDLDTYFSKNKNKKKGAVYQKALSLHSRVESKL